MAPTFNPRAETLVGPTYTVFDNRVEQSWTKRALTAREISARDQIEKDSIPEAVRAEIDDHEARIAALEGRG